MDDAGISKERRFPAPVVGQGNKFYIGSEVQLLNGETTRYVIDRLGTNPGVYRITRPTGGGYWVTEDMIMGYISDGVKLDEFGEVA